MTRQALHIHASGPGDVSYRFRGVRVSWASPRPAMQESLAGLAVQISGPLVYSQPFSMAPPQKGQFTVNHPPIPQKIKNALSPLRDKAFITLCGTTLVAAFQKQPLVPHNHGAAI